ncbi:kinetochore protein spc24-like [Portunus trituberculatus]|uniref:kinetochore protein spc24-like n=1 Tax=Portunus trituberculatus TaxID=210409 RepID=UPI001E1CCB8B|nr:kinetochore protein spc24-like [Portunus trituberculatus]
MTGEKTSEELQSEIKKVTFNEVEKLKKAEKGKTAFQELMTCVQSSTVAIKRKEDDLKENIRELLSIAETEESHSKELNSQSLEPQKKNLKTNTAKAEKQKDDIDKEIAEVTNTITHKKEVLKDIQNRANFSHQETSASISRIRTEYRLYSKVFNIKWDHTVPDRHIKGFVIKPTEKRVVPIKFDKASHSQFFITNFLWEQISGGCCLDEPQSSKKS